MRKDGAVPNEKLANRDVCDASRRIQSFEHLAIVRICNSKVVQHSHRQSNAQKYDDAAPTSASYTSIRHAEFAKFSEGCNVMWTELQHITLVGNGQHCLHCILRNALWKHCHCATSPSNGCGCEYVMHATSDFGFQMNSTIVLLHSSIRNASIWTTELRMRQELRLSTISTFNSIVCRLRYAHSYPYFMDTISFHFAFMSFVYGWMIRQSFDLDPFDSASILRKTWHAVAHSPHRK